MSCPQMRTCVFLINKCMWERGKNHRQWKFLGEVLGGLSLLVEGEEEREGKNGAGGCCAPSAVDTKGLHV